MSEKTNTEISKLAVGGPGLSFIGISFKFISFNINGNIYKWLLECFKSILKHCP